MTQPQEFRVHLGDTVLAVKPAASSEAGALVGAPALEAALEALGPKDLLQFAEQLRRFAEAAGFRAAAALEDVTRSRISADLEELGQSSPGMRTSVGTGRLVHDAPEEVVALEIAAVRGIARMTAAREVGRARTLVDDLPDVLSRMAAGGLGPAHARSVVDLADKIEPERIAEQDTDDPAACEQHERRVEASRRECRRRRQAFGADLLERSSGKTPGQLERYGKRRLEKELDEPFAQRHRRAADRRFVAVDADEDGMCFLSAYIPTVAAEAIDRRLAEFAAAQKHRDAVAGDEDERTLAQVRADAFIDILLSGPEAVGLQNVKPEVTVTVPSTVFPGLAVLADQGGSAPGLLDGESLAPGADLPEAERFGSFGLDELAAILPQASTWTRVVTDPWTGAITAFDAEAYRPPRALRRALALRDRTCRVPGCGRRATACEPDHVIERQDGGRTELSNLVSVCKRCHRLKSWGLLTFDLHPDGTLIAETWWGTRRKTLPDAPWAAWPMDSPPPRSREADTGTPTAQLFILESPIDLGKPAPASHRSSKDDEEFAEIVARLERSLVSFMEPCPF
ncbi:HNH endonuclease signature motif containing protein [Zhihengliuella halotolerans]|uniref:HNH endonuclease n=1 Tax=Zhihengliuella halotolerans TaxID=370736 RepID=A0A4Q8ADF3_9MICC|nr:HNH endonuclease signature motif containing protein [Zhihengliuella halotolerans]RZU62270.1 HNH endonuclease [Zhihengliuella halotolerans]